MKKPVSKQPVDGLTTIDAFSHELTTSNFAANYTAEFVVKYISGNLQIQLDGVSSNDYAFQESKRYFFDTRFLRVNNIQSTISYVGNDNKMYKPKQINLVRTSSGDLIWTVPDDFNSKFKKAVFRGKRDTTYLSPIGLIIPKYYVTLRFKYSQ